MLKLSDFYKSTGVLSKEDLELVLPPQERMKAGPVAVIECLQNIPCNPCSAVCPKGAISISGDMTELPEFDSNKCNGCALCVPQCPGLAIFVIDARQEHGEWAYVTIPYEFLPLPEPGDKVVALARDGASCGEAIVEKVVNSPKFDKTALVTLKVKRELVNIVRHFHLKKGSD